MKLAGKVALVTGASRGVGAATALALARAGCAVACAARATRAAPQKTPGTLDETLQRIEAEGGKALAVPTNLAREEEVVGMVRRTVDHFGRLDILINNAAITFVGDLAIPMKRHDLVMEVNLRAPFLAIREALPQMTARGEGAIVNVSSLAAVTYQPALMSYGVSKLGLERLTVDVANQVHRQGVAVSCFRIDVAVASEGFVANTPGADHESWEPASVPAEGILWLLRQGTAASGKLFSMAALRRERGVMDDVATRPWDAPAATGLADGLAAPAENIFVGG